MGAFAVIIILYQCPIRKMFGYECPGCGMTTAILMALKFDFQEAFEYHSLYPIVVIFSVYVFFREELYVGKKYEQIGMAVALTLFVVRWMVNIM